MRDVRCMIGPTTDTPYCLSAVRYKAPNVPS
jgi:hypothetical protein